MKFQLFMLPVVMAFLLPGLASAEETDRFAYASTTANTAAPPETAQLQFMVGNWIMKTRLQMSATDTRESESELHVRYILDGFALQIVERHPPGPPPGNPDQAFFNTTILNYDSDNKKWTGASVNSLGNRKFVEGEFKGGVFTLLQTGKLFRNRPGSNRLIFENISDDRFEYRLEYRLQDWADWQSAGYGYTAERK